MLIYKNQKTKRIFVVFLLILGIIIPFLLVTFLDFYHRYDISAFHDWADCWHQKSYLECQPGPPTYPAIGLALSAGVVHAITSIFGIANSDTSYLIFRYYLAFFDSLNFLLLVWLASLMRFRFPLFIGLILLIIPSTWAGSAVWGQIEGISLFFCLLSVIGFFKSWLVSDRIIENQTVWKSGIYLLLGTLSLACYILTKQLAIFSLPFFFLLILITMWKYWKYFPHQGFVWLFSALSLFILSFYAIDSFLEVPNTFHNSSYWFVWTGGGSSQGDKISGNGFNIWIFLGRNMKTSSRIPFLTLQFGNWQARPRPYQTGIILYAILVAFLWLTCFKKSWKILNQKVGTEQRAKVETYLISFLCFFHGLCHLGFNVLLTGTHERYLYLGYPFLLISVLWFSVHHIVFSGRSVMFCFFAAFAYGCFVINKIEPLPKLLFPLQRNEFLGSLHLFLLVFLVDSWMQLCQVNKLIRKLKKMPFSSFAKKYNS